MKDKKNIYLILLVVVTLIILIVTYITNNNEKDKKEDINIVVNYNDFYTVDSCLYRVVTYITSKNTENLLLVLNDKYKQKNNISSKNILDIFYKIDEDSTFVSEKMYYVGVSDNITKYYVYGKVEQEYYTNDSSFDAYFIVYLDKTNKTFSVEPYDGEIFLRWIYEW